MIHATPDSADNKKRINLQSLYPGDDTHKINYIVKDFGIFLSKKSERLVVRKEGKVIRELPFFALRSIIIQGKGASLSSDLVAKCSQYGIQIDFLGFGGNPIAKIYSPVLSATIEIQKAQYEALNNGKGLALIIALIQKKLDNQKRFLKHLNKYRQSPIIADKIGVIETMGLRCGELFEKPSLSVAEGYALDAVRNSLLGYEGVAGTSYWQGLKEVIKDKVDFPGRRRQGARDLVNSMLNYGYGILYSRVWGMVALAGMEPFLGYLHTDRSGKPSLVLDLVEAFRILIDHSVITIINESKKDLPTTFDERMKDAVVNRVLKKLESRQTYRATEFTLESILQQVIRNVSMFLRGEDKLELHNYHF